MIFPVVIHKEPTSDYGVTEPDLPGCFSGGSTMDEALSNAREAIECHIEGFLMDCDSVPMIGNIEEHQANKDFSGGTWALVDVDLSRLDSKVKRYNITMT